MAFRYTNETASPHLNNCIAPKGRVFNGVVVVIATGGIVVVVAMLSVVVGCVVTDEGAVGGVVNGGGGVWTVPAPEFCPLEF